MVAEDLHDGTKALADGFKTLDLTTGAATNVGAGATTTGAAATTGETTAAAGVVAVTYDGGVHTGAAELKTKALAVGRSVEPVELEVAVGAPPRCSFCVSVMEALC